MRKLTIVVTMFWLGLPAGTAFADCKTEGVAVNDCATVNPMRCTVNGETKMCYPSAVCSFNILSQPPHRVCAIEARTACGTVSSQAKLDWDEMGRSYVKVVAGQPICE